MSRDVDATLAAQGLDRSDLEANRTGRVTEKQIDRQAGVRGSGGLGVWGMVLVGLVGGGIGVAKFIMNGQPGGAIFMAALCLFLIALPLGIFYTFRFPSPAKVGACRVTRIDNAHVDGFIPSTRRVGVYAIRLNQQPYSGFATDLDRAHFGERVNAYVVAQHKIIVALEPID